MNRTSRAALLAFVAAGLVPAAAQAQWIHTGPSQPPLYPYAVQTNQPYAVQVSPNTYVIHRPNEAQLQPRHRNRTAAVPVNDRPPASGRVRTKADPALVEELGNRNTGNRARPTAISTTRVVRDKPVVVETKRYVDDPPRVVERYVDANGRPVRTKANRTTTAVIDAPVLDNPVSDKPKGKDDVKRVINAEAEITILGPDRMNIRLYRKGSKPGAND